MHILKRCGALILLALLLAPVTRAEILEQILVKVNGEIITKTALEQRQTEALRERNAGVSAATLDDAQLRQQLAEITPEVVVDAVDEMLLLQRAKELGYTVSDEQFRSVLDNIKKDNKIESDEQFETALKQEGMTLAQLRATLERRMLIGHVQQVEVSSKLTVNEAEERQYYDSHLTEFETTPGVTLREILVAVPTDGTQVNVAADEAGRDRAEALRARILKGESFEKIAAEVSEAPSKANGGLIGPIPRDELAPEFLKLLATMKVGDITQPLRVPNGYTLLKLESSVESTTLPFDAARRQIAERVFSQRLEGEMEKYLQKLRAQAIIEWKNDEIRKAYEQGIAARARA